MSDVRKMWHVAPTLSVDFVGYYLGLYALTRVLLTMWRMFAGLGLDVLGLIIC